MRISIFLLEEAPFPLEIMFGQASLTRISVFTGTLLLQVALTEIPEHLLGIPANKTKKEQSRRNFFSFKKSSWGGYDLRLWISSKLSQDSK